VTSTVSVPARTNDPIVAQLDVLLVDDHALIGQSLTVVLRAAGLSVDRCTDLTRTGIVEAAHLSRPAVLLLDLDVGGELGTTLPLIPQLCTTSRVLMLTGVSDRVRLAECLEAGAIGIIDKRDPFEQLVCAIHEAVVRGVVVPAAHRHELLAELRCERQARTERLRPFANLTRREQEVLAALLDGLLAERIAQRDVVSLTTVRSQIRAILQKLGVNSQLEAVARARHAGWKPSAVGFPQS
jgi:two-component system, NarL family, nitrate/nitrite response regulator NarL